MNDDILTTEDSERVVSDIETALGGLYKSSGSLDVSHLHPAVANILNNQNKGSLGDELRKLGNEVKSRKTINITMSFVPSRDLVKRIHSWMWKNLGIRVLISFNIDSGVLGGCNLSYEGRYFDYSLERMVNEYFSKKEEV